MTSAVVGATTTSTSTSTSSAATGGDDDDSVVVVAPTPSDGVFRVGEAVVLHVGDEDDHKRCFSIVPKLVPDMVVKVRKERVRLAAIVGCPVGTKLVARRALGKRARSCPQSHAPPETADPKVATQQATAAATTPATKQTTATTAAAATPAKLVSGSTTAKEPPRKPNAANAVNDGDYYGGGGGSTSILEPYVPRKIDVGMDCDQSQEGSCGASGGADNRSLNDDNTSQHMTAERISQLKKAGAKGEDIIENLVQNSASFKKKTVFSQKKYLQKKKNKYVTVITPLKLTAYVLATAYFTKHPAKILCMRPDTVGRLLYSANVHSGSTTMVCESCKGLLLISVAERISGTGNGKVIQALLPGFYPKSYLSVLQLFPPNQLAPTKFVNWNELSAPPTMTTASAPPQGEALNCDSLVVATAVDPISIAGPLMRHLKPGGYFAFYSQFMQDLVELHEYLFPVSCELQLSESWKREYQVLPQSTHPHMQMHGASGFILSGIKVKPCHVTKDC
ncbi:tRNA-methyltransferase subunit [Pelomyxa schiedti]|nr:tRNA-methyltransferase subunit [Pelomyxa schiedti]